MFELHITCTKDIDKLKIDFSDGTTVVSEKSKNVVNKTVNKNCTNKKSKKEVETENKQEYNTDWSVYDKPLTLSSGNSKTKFDDIVPDTSNRPVFVDDNLQNLDL